MPIDVSILRQQAPMQMPSLMESRARANQLMASDAQLAANALQLQRAQREEQQAQDINKLYSLPGAVSPTGEIDYGVIGQAAPGMGLARLLPDLNKAMEGWAATDEQGAILDLADLIHFMGWCFEASARSLPTASVAGLVGMERQATREQGSTQERDRNGLDTIAAAVQDPRRRDGRVTLWLTPEALSRRRGALITDRRTRRCG